MCLPSCRFAAGSLTKSPAEILLCNVSSCLELKLILHESKVTYPNRSGISGSDAKKELIVQIMRPSILYPPLQSSSLYQKALKIAHELLGNDMLMDFDMLIDGSPLTNKETAFH